MGSPAFEKIAQGLREAARVAACDHHGCHPFASKPGRPTWQCVDCGAEFSRDPRKPRHDL